MLSTCILTCALYEHAYIYSFIQHYQKLGFDKIYLLEDRNQPPIPIPSNLQISIHKIPVYYPPHLNNFGKVQLWNFTFLIQNVIKEDWIFLCDIDEFLYLPDDKTISTYLHQTLHFYKNQDIGQIQFPWMIVEYSGKSPQSYSQLLHENQWYANDEVKSIIKRSAFQSIPDNHHFHLKYHVQTLHHQHILTHKPQKRYPKLKLSQYYEFQKYPFVIHFHTRGMNNIATKILTYQYKDKAGEEERNILLRAIQQKNPLLWKRTEKYKLIHDHSKNPKITKWKIPFDQYPIQNDIEEENLRLILLKYGISWEIYQQFLNKTCLS